MSDRIYINTPEFRVSYPNVFKAVQFKGKGEPKFNINMLWPKDINLTELKNACRKVAISEWGEDYLKGIKWPFKDGNVRAKDVKHEMYKDTIWCVASTKQKPQIVQPDARTYIQDDEAAFYAGCWAKAILNPFAYEGGDGRGVTFGLGNLQKVRDDDPFSGRPPAADQFEPVETGADDPANYEEMVGEYLGESGTLDLA